MRRIVERNRWLTAIALMASVLCLGAAARANDGNEVVEVTPVEMGVETRPVVLSRVASKMRPGQVIGSAKAGLLCVPNSPVLYDSNAALVQQERLTRAFYAEVSAAGFTSPVDPDNLFPEDPPATEYLVAASIEAVNLDGCFPYAGMGDVASVKGTASYTVEWQIYSGLERKVIAKVRTDSVFTIKKSRTGAIAALSEGAFAINARKFLASPEFRSAFIGAARAPEPIAKLPGLKPIPYVNRNTGPSTISDGIGAVVALISGGSHGSGFLIDASGLLLTNHHVVGQSKYLKVRWSDGVETLGEVIRSDPRRDVALVKTDPRGRAPLKLSGKIPASGEDVYAIGAPIEQTLQSSVTKGVVSATRVRDGLNFIQSDVTINGGNSGGPLLDKDANVVGVCVSGLGTADGALVGINFFIPLRDALEFLALEPQA